LYVSLHEDPTGFPGTGFADEVGQAEGFGYTVNVPLPYGTSDQIYLKAFDEIVDPIIREYAPQFLLVSAGLDGHYGDPVGQLALSASCYGRIYDRIMLIARDMCRGKVVSVLEGGYSLRWVGKIAGEIVAKLSGASYEVFDRQPVPNIGVLRQGEKVIREVRRVQGAFWNLK
jgi:acetoin utilization deacetylase AcuC-like enzyme